MAPTHGKNADVFGNGYVLSPFLNSASFAGKRDSAETTTFKKNSKTFIPGLKDTTLALAGVWDGVTDAIDDIFYQALNSGSGVFSYIPAGQEVVGSRVWTMDSISIKYDVNTAIGGVAQCSADFMVADGGSFTRGVVNHPLFNEVALGSGATVNNAVATVNGGGLTVHATTPSVSLVVFLQDSADGTTWADLPGSVVIPSGVRSSQSLNISGTIRQYTRVRWTGTGQFMSITERL